MLVRSPVAGRIVVLQDVPDPVFAEAMVGPGIAIDPTGEAGRDQGAVDIVAPITGKVAVLHPHAFAIESEAGSVLVHLGLDTVTLKGAPFELVRAVGDEVKAGEVIVRWKVDGIGALSPLVPVVALGVKEVELGVQPGDDVAPGDSLFTVPQD